MTAGTRTAWASGSVGLLAGLVSLARIVVANDDALAELVWAEDGLFALCVKAHGPISCTAEPYAGYLLALPRLVAAPVSLFPLDSWPLVTNLAAAVLAGALAALTVVILRAAGCGWVASALVAMLPTVLPLMGIEAVNSTANSYMVIPFVAALAISFPPRGRFPAVATFALLLLAQLSNPLTAVLLVIVLIHALRGAIPRRGAILAGSALLIGLALQAIAIATAANPRRIAWSVESAREWAESAPIAVLGVWRGNPGVQADGSLASILVSGPIAAAGVVLTVLVVVLAVACLLPRFSTTTNGVGAMLLVGLALGFLPALAGEPNNRYFVAAAVSWSAAGLIALDRWLPTRRELVMGAVAAAFILMCIPGFAASTFRTYAAPSWPQMLADARASCESSPDGLASVMFTPSWPYADAVFPGPTNNRIGCELLLPR